ncbi:MAG: hypothetical protein CMH83_09525 [Nocardioides sp.]|nr:hypothetical protein [Nocardioides sp.]
MVGGRYRLGERLGRGGAADVHRATDEVLGRDVAVKTLRDATADSRDRARFDGEARLLARLTHPSLVTVLDAGVDDDVPFLVMELVEGPTLADRVAAGPMAPRPTAELGAALADALAYAHAREVVHRDVKPANVLLGVGDRVKLADFGIARLLGDSARHTATGTTIGTAAYLAPEQVRGHDVTPACDVYSLGLLLLECLTAERAFPGPVTESALARLHRAPDLPDDLDAEWRSLLAAMTALEPGERPSAEDAATRLHVLADDHEPETVVRPADDGAGTTAVLPQDWVTEQPEQPDPAPARPARAPDAGYAAGERADVVVARTGERWRGLSWTTRLVVAALAALLVIAVLVIALRGADDPGPALPEGVPADLQGPLADLHSAVGSGA